MTDQEQFEVWYKAYPKKVAKGDARKAWNQTQKIRPSLEKLIEAVKLQCQTEQWMKDGHAYIPYPATWLRAERWDDEVEVKIEGVVANKPWHETWVGIVAKGKELGIKEEDFSHPQAFKAEVIRVVGDRLKAA